jgi:hypothetical protein
MSYLLHYVHVEEEEGKLTKTMIKVNKENSKKKTSLSF